MASPGWDAKEFDNHLEPEPKKLISPAGLRLSTILESSSSSTTKVGSSTTTKGSRRPSFSKKFKLPGGDRDSDETYRQGYTYNIFSEKDEGPPQLPPRQQSNGFFARRGGWRKILLIALLFLAVVVAIAVGLAVGLRKQSGNGSSDATSVTQNAGATNSGSSAGTTGTGSNANTTTPLTNDNATFPLGTYSIATFLDTVQNNCTTNANTWTCFPYTIYNTSPQKALTTFNFIITPDPKQSMKYLISSTDNPFAINFANTSLTLEGQGTAQERYTFRAAMSKKVVPSAGITSDNSATTCFFNGTNFQGSLYTRLAKTYDPVALGISSSQAGLTYPAWPNAVRAEQVSSGGAGTPDCYKTVNGVLGDKVDIEVTENGAGNLCSCLYRNWVTTNTQPY